jgi:hypothetical protein
MNKLTNLRTLFTAVAILEFFYFASAMIPPSMVKTFTGWELNADGHWITKLLGLALGTMGYVAWVFRKNPHLGVVKGLAAYQIASATMDWIMWNVMKEEGIFSNQLAQTTVIAAIISHYILGLLLIMAINKPNANE